MFSGLSGTKALKEDDGQGWEVVWRGWMKAALPWGRSHPDLGMSHRSQESLAEFLLERDLFPC